MNGTAAIINGTADHVHMLIRIRPAHAPAEIARVVKTNSSRWICERSPEFAWQTGYGVFSVSESNVPAVTKYIAQQEQRHKKYSFQDEFRVLLAKNKIVVDEKYLWGWFFRPSGASLWFQANPRLTPWAALSRRVAAAPFFGRSFRAAGNLNVTHARGGVGRLYLTRL